MTVTDSEVTLDERSFRQLAIKGLGRDQPTLLLTNRRQMTGPSNCSSATPNAG